MHLFYAKNLKITTIRHNREVIIILGDLNSRTGKSANDDVITVCSKSTESQFSAGKIFLTIIVVEKLLFIR